MNKDTNPKTMILEYIHQSDKLVRTKQLINYLLDATVSRKEAWDALQSLEKVGYISNLGGAWCITTAGMKLMGWIV